MEPTVTQLNALLEKVPYLSQALPYVLLAVATICSLYIVRGLVLPLLRKAAERSTITWDDKLFKHRVLDRATHFVPAVVFAFGLPLAVPAKTELFGFLLRLSNVYFILVGFLVFIAALNVLADIYQSNPKRQHVPIGGFVQAIKLCAFLFCFILTLSQLADRSPVYFLSGLGAVTAVLMLIFKDSILGLVAGVQITAMDLVRKGDWIEMPEHGADGDVVDVSLTTVRVQNWDRTISTIPAYELVSASFKNWRHMSEGGGRRIKRAIPLDINTIRFVDEPLLEQLKGITLLRPYLEERLRELEEYNRSRIAAEEFKVLANGRRLTNIGTFRAYCVAYLRSHPAIRQDMTFIVRQLNPGADGLPLEIYVFCADTRWAVFEGIQSDIFDHLLAVLPEFGLRAFQAPTGLDLRQMGLVP